MTRYRKLPVEIDAKRLMQDNAAAVVSWASNFGGKDRRCVSVSEGALMIQTLEGVMTANVGDWLIRGVAGEFYPCKPEIFAKTYEVVS